MNGKWQKRYLELAKVISTWSKDPRKQVGAVIYNDERICGTGFNGFPRGVKDDPSLLLNKEAKNAFTVHAEANAILNSVGQGHTICVWPCLPCPQCMALISQEGLSKVVTSGEYKDMPTSWDVPRSLQLAKLSNIKIFYF